MGPCCRYLLHFFWVYSLPEKARLGNRATRDGFHSQVIPILVLDEESRLDIAQGILLRDLCIQQDRKLLPADEFLRVAVSAMPSLENFKLVSRQDVQELSEHGGSIIEHGKRGKAGRD